MFELVAEKKCDVYGVSYPFNSRFTVDDPLVVMECDGCRIVKAKRRNPKHTKGKKIAIHQNGVARVGGMETLLHNLSNQFPNSDVTFYYGYADKMTIVELSKNWNCVEYNGEEIECDVMILMSCDSDDVVRYKAEKVYSFFGHQDWRAFKEIKKNEKYWKGFKPVVKDTVDVAMSVSKAAKNGLKEVLGIDSMVVPNVLYKEPKRLRLFTPTRLSPDKGTDNMVYMIEEFVASKIPFVWLIVGGNQAEPSLIKRLSCYPEVCIIPANNNLRWLIEWCDWCVITSQAEAFCYAAYEALECKKPVCMLECEQAHAIVKDGKNGVIFSQDLEDFNTDVFLKKQEFDLRDFNKIKAEGMTKWNKIMKGEL